MKKFYYFLFASILTFVAAACSSDEEPVEELTVSILNNGTEIGDNEIIKYTAEKDLFGDYVAGSDTEPVIKASQPCKLEVAITIPKSELKYVQWCGVTHECEQFAESGTYTRVLKQMVNAESMQMHAYFKKGISAKCNIKVVVKINDKTERTFYLSYEYVASEEDPEVDEDDYAKPALRSPVVAVEFTGQRCRYCPNLSRSLKAWEDKYGKENYIITALHHLEEYSLLPKNHVSLYNAEAKEYAASIKVHGGLPQIAYNTLGPTVPDEKLDEMFKLDDLLECTGKVQFNEKKEYVIDIHTRLRSNQKNAIKGKKIDILFWAMENDIVAFQDDNGAWTYPGHQHIFRGSINGTWGEPYQIGSSYKGTKAIPSSVSVLANSEVVVFFLDNQTKTILDAARFSVSEVK